MFLFKNGFHMKFDKRYLGKWVAATKDKVIESDKTLTKLIKKVSNRKDSNQLRFALIPKGHIAGFLS
ncbi:MAG: hypothetical protein A2V81_01645 [Candidatus Abawacabacteria bacterium RBG_16_42_10]|uniref:DUF5678 domain-containing protein n=1 Tax=Candidatus Abawacabacteria bacterium RBG_16_42_10 TaxID=1817814 RepID=A0A1F4XL32_9BACT|nr:MAG: hypothetical protein A2V81_01645 [Candidatus Abawacabacteria bacterium RBG_16_42_10]